MAKAKPKTGRPLLKIDPDQVAKLAAINCSYAEMAAVLDCDESTLTKRFSQVIQKGRSSGRMSLKRKQYEMAMQGNVTMLIWLGKQLLDQTDKRDYEVKSQVNQTSSLDEESKNLLEEFKSVVENASNERQKS
jgi:hypothetical protein